MALIKCPKCENAVSSYAVKCPNCGAPVKELVAGNEKNNGEMQHNGILSRKSGIVSREKDREKAFASIITSLTIYILFAITFGGILYMLIVLLNN